MPPNAPDAAVSFRVLHVSDTHLGESDQSGADAWTNFVRFTEWSRPDLLVHSGDVVHNDPDSDDDYLFSAFQMRRLTIPWRAIPGNHDVGDSAPDPYHGLITLERLERYRSHFGEDRWSVVAGNWLLIGLNSQLFDNVLEEEEEGQWEWFGKQLQDHPDKLLAVFIHKPPCIVSLDESMFVNKTIGLGGRARLLDLAKSGRLRLIGCGHLHEFMTLQTYGVVVVAAPSLAGAAPEGVRRQLGLRCNGAVEYHFSGQGFRYRLLEEEELQAPLLAYRVHTFDALEV